ncbi:hypothetical protein MXB_1165 [Myxobolus squamalis]|nr:hypothetical protein MXB_1165 [Myxobolus squamalis]
MAMQSTKFKENPQKLGELLEAKTLLDDYDGIEGLCAKLDASLDTGLQENPEMLKIRRDYFEMVQNPSGGGVDGVAILSAVIIIVVVTSVNDYTKELKFKNLHKTIKLGNTCTIMREGRIFDISTKDLVVGDVYLPKYGDQVPADCVIFEETGLKTEESSITGESELVKKDIKNKPYLLASTYINEGSGKALVVAVGYYAQTGRILKLLGVTKQKKKEKLNRLALLIGKIGVGAETILDLNLEVLRLKIY